MEANSIRAQAGDHYEDYLKTKEKEKAARVAQAKREEEKRQKEKQQRERDIKRRRAAGDDSWMLEGSMADDEDIDKIDIEAADQVDDNSDQQWAACIKEYFPLHDDDELLDLMTIWARPGLILKHPFTAIFKGATLRPWGIILELQKLTEQPLQDIRNYFGEQIGLYYAFLGVYTTSLFWPAVIGLITFVGRLQFGVDKNPLALPYSIYMMLWSVQTLSKWFQRYNAPVLALPPRKY
eukprot:SAG31_NODE_796_length_12032_cov_21.073242_14_plen_237_part_00